MKKIVYFNFECYLIFKKEVIKTIVDVFALQLKVMVVENCLFTLFVVNHYIHHSLKI